MRHHPVMTVVMALAVVLLVLVAPCWAETTTTPDAMFVKLGRGVSNVLTGWLEIPYGVKTSFERTNPVGTTVTGLIKGTAIGVGRTVVGAVEVVTFWLPVPADYAPIMPDPEYFGTP